MSALVRSLLCVVVGLTLLVSPAVHAQDAAQQARALFERGLQEADATHWPQAAELFQQALVLRDSPVIRFNLSSALAELGKLTDALVLLRALEQDTRTSPELKPRVLHDLQAIERRLAQLTLRVDSDAADWKVLLDEHELPRTQVGVAIPLDPKLHYVSLRAGERVLDDKQVELHEGELRELLLAGKVPPPVVVAQAPAPRLTFTNEPPHDDGMSKRKRRVIWGVTLATAAVAAGVVTGVMLARRDAGGGASSADAFSPGRVRVRVPQ